ncbi:MAG: S9 family peptidase [bacterium]|nr:S9 family peptidase [bacterium]
MTVHRLLLVLLGALATAGAAAAMVPEDLRTMRTVAVADLSPDGRHLIYSVTAWDAAAGTSSSHLYRRDLDTGEDLLLFAPADRSRGPVWRPDGEAMAFLRETDDGTELWLMDADGGERRRATTWTGTFGPLRWSPDGTALAWTAGGTVGEYAGEPGVRVVAENLGYRHLDTGLREGRLGQVFVLELADGAVRRLFEAPLDARGLDWSPDGVNLVFAAKHRADLGWNLDTNLWLVPRAGGEPRRLTANPGPDEKPRWLPDGRIAYVRAVDPLWESGPRTVTMLDPDAGENGDPVHHAFPDFFWRYAVHDGWVHVLGTRRGSMDLVRLAPAAEPEILTDGEFDYWSIHVGGHRAVLAGAGQTLPSGIFVVDLDRGGARLEIDPNAAWRARADLVVPEPFSVEVDGTAIEGWFFKPLDAGPDHPVPLVLSIHGGPEWMYGGYFLPEFHVLPRFGYGVVMANPVGSTGYGYEFQAAIRGDWVERPSREVLACVDLAVAQGWADPDRLAVMGGSYGGFLGAELTVRTDRFRAAALDRMLPDPVTFWGTTDEKWFPEWEFHGRPWDPEARPVYERNSPYDRADRCDTPTLVSHGMRDYRCLVTGAEMWFSALQARGVPSRLIRFEQEGHGISGLENRIFYLEELLTWFDRHVLETQAGEVVEHE